MIRVFVLIYETRSVTLTTERLFISQLSVSCVLGKLRRTFNNELFFRSPAGKSPTELADAVYPRLRESLAAIDGTMLGAVDFDPATSRRKFPSLHHLAVVARSVSVEVVPFNASSARQALVMGSADAVICTPRIDVDVLWRDVLSVQEYCGICATDHPPRLRGHRVLGQCGHGGGE